MTIERKIQREKLRLIDANKLLVRAKWFYFTTLILTGVISKITSGINANANFSPYWMSAITLWCYLYNYCLYYFFKNAHISTYKKIKIASYINLIIDQFLITLVIYFAGGLTSISFLYYIYPIAASGFFFSLKETALVSTLASILYGSLIIFQFFDIIPYLSRYNFEYESFLAHNPSAVVTNLWAVVTSFYIVGAFVGLMARSMRQKEKEAARERDKVEAIIENLNDGLIYIDNTGKVDMINPRAAALIEIKAKEFIGKPAREIKSSEHPLLKQILDYNLKIKKEFSPKDKPDIVYLASSRAIFDNEARPIGKIKIIRDVSREKFMSKMKSEFITIAGHQLRTPLSAIKLALNVLKEGDYGEVNKEQKELLGRGQVYVERLITIVNDLLNVSSIEEGKFDYQYEQTDIGKLLKEISDSFTREAGEKKIKLILNIAGDIPLIEIDLYKIKLALGSIISNAIIYSKEAGEVKINCGFEGDVVVISVEDKGIGIPRYEQNKVFTKFFRSTNAIKHVTEGNGLDLFVAKNIIDNHEGQIWFESRAGQGTVFYIELPLKRISEDNDKQILGEAMAEQ